MKLLLGVVLYLVLATQAFATEASPQSIAEGKTENTSLKDFNIQIHPVGLLFGAYGAYFDAGIADQWTLGSSFTYLEEKPSATSTTTAIQWGLHSRFFFRHPRFEKGPYLKAGVSYFDVSKVRDTTQLGVSLHNWSSSLLIGYHWPLLSELNVSLGTGIAYYSAPDKVTQGTTLISASGIQPILEFAVGCTF